MSTESGATLPPPGHIGVVVRDVDKTTKFLSSALGLGPWEIMETAQGKDVVMVGGAIKQKLAMTQLGPTVLELIQQLEGKGVWTEFLEKNGEGVHHIAFNVPNWDEMVSRLKEHGSKLVAGGIFQGKRWCYFDTEPGGLVIEFMEA